MQPVWGGDLRGSSGLVAGFLSVGGRGGPGPAGVWSRQVALRGKSEATIARRVEFASLSEEYSTHPVSPSSPQAASAPLPAAKRSCVVTSFQLRDELCSGTRRAWGLRLLRPELRIGPTPREKLAGGALLDGPIEDPGVLGNQRNPLPQRLEGEAPKIQPVVLDAAPRPDRRAAEAPGRRPRGPGRPHDARSPHPAARGPAPSGERRGHRELAVPTPRSPGSRRGAARLPCSSPAGRRTARGHPPVNTDWRRRRGPPLTAPGARPRWRQAVPARPGRAAVRESRSST